MHLPVCLYGPSYCAGFPSARHDFQDGNTVRGACTRAHAVCNVMGGLGCGVCMGFGLAMFNGQSSY